ncbi:MAG: HAD-IIB family hydrolase, partial [Candidatus Eremiobacteraeota bacterium]|nr:HAD-IIB family hydrolase [Candidatus Eremiobacteraeota bacterium]
GVGALGYLDDELYAEREDALVARYEGLSQVRARMIPSLRELFENRASTKIVILLPRVEAAEYAANLRESLGSEAYVTRSIPEYIEVLDPKVNKGAALAAVARHYGVGLEETLAIGDSWNDEPLLRAAGVGVAMGNSPPELLAVADAVVGDVFHDGVAEALERFVLGAAPEAVR